MMFVCYSLMQSNFILVLLSSQKKKQMSRERELLIHIHIHILHRLLFLFYFSSFDENLNSTYREGRETVKVSCIMGNQEVIESSNNIVTRSLNRDAGSSNISASQLESLIQNNNNVASNRTTH